VIDAKSSEIRRGIEFRVQTNDESNITLGEMAKNILERAWDVGLFHGRRISR